MISFATNNLDAQINLVPNNSFEDTIAGGCPNGGSQIEKVVGWHSYRGTPDYFNACSFPGFWSVPYNLVNYQNAADGNAYAGIVTYAWDTTLEGREVIGRELSGALIIGQKYYVSFKANLVLDTQLGTTVAANKLGILFSTVSFSNADSAKEVPINNFAHIYTDNIISDTVNWTTVSGSLIADSAYSYLCIGNFFYNINTDTIVLINDTTYGSVTYYFIDDICVSTDSITCNKQVGIEKNANSCIRMFPNPSKNIINISCSSLYHKNIKIKIYNSIGILLNEYHKDLPYSLVDISNLNQGLYFINISYDNTQLNQKLIVEN